MARIMQRTAIVLTSALLLLTSACTKIKPVYSTAEQPFESQIVVGEKVRITYIDSSTKDIFVTEVSDKEIKGTLAKSNKVLPKVSALKTVGTGLGIIVAIPIIAAGGVLAVAAGG